jgi:hypothetical protein
MTTATLTANRVTHISSVNEALQASVDAKQAEMDRLFGIEAELGRVKRENNELRLMGLGSRMADPYSQSSAASSFGPSQMPLGS